MKKYLPIIALILISIFLCFQNYTLGTFLSGWDTLHPEFNFGLAIKREFFGVFRTYQGLGAVAAHSDMADLPRIILLYLVSPFVPISFLRYFYIFLTLIMGPIGMYYFLKRVVFLSIPNRNSVPSFLGALFYLLNLGAMQQFIVPFEMFTTQYATIPWLFLFATEYLQDKIHQKKTLILFATTTFFSMPMAYAATLWYVYFIGFIIYLATLILILKQKKRVAQKAFVLLLLTLLLNSFWILPNIYFIFNHASEVTRANINRLFSPQAFLYNKEFGNIQDISLLKTFLFDWNVYSDNHQFTQLLRLWIVHLKQPFVQGLGFLFASITLIGIIYGILKRNKIAFCFLPLLLLCLLFLFNDNSPSSPLYTFLADKIPFFKEIFRFPQDKVLGIFTFIFAVYFAIGQLLIMKFIKVIKNRGGVARLERLPTARTRSVPKERLAEHWREGKAGQDPDGTKLYYAQVCIFVIILFYFMLPAFKGNFISPYMRIKIPEFYFEMFNWFDKEAQDGRIASLPIHSLWGWDYYQWYQNSLPSYQGAGFIWFGIKQPLLSRDFDRWSPYNEQYYREMSYAIYSQSPGALKLVLDKYNITYILIDKSIIAPGNDSKGGYRTVPSRILLHKESRAMLEKLDNIEKIKEFGKTILVYKVKSGTPNNTRVIKNPAFVHEEFHARSNVVQTFYEDVAYKDYGNYVTAFRHSGKPKAHPESPANSDSGQARMTDFEKTSSVYYPLANLIDNGGKILPNKLQITQEGVVIELPKDSSMDFTLPSYLDTQDSIPADVLVEKNQKKLIISLYPLFPTLDINHRPAPIITKTTLPQTNEIILSINKKNNFTFNVPTTVAPLSLGSVILNTKKNNTIAIYSSTPNEKILPDLSNIKYSLSPCDNQQNQKVFGIDNVQSNSFYIFGKNIPLCMTIPLSQVILKDLKTSEALLNVTFSYKSNLPLKFCIAKLINSTCQNYSDNRLNQYFGIQSQDIQDLGLHFQLDTTFSSNIEKAYYNNLTLSLTYPFSLEILPNDALKKSLEPIEQNLLKASTITLPFSSNKELSADITKLPKTSGFCPNTPLSNPKLIKKQILTNSKDRFIRYESIDGLSCDHFSYQNISQNEAYLIAITSRNVKGLPSTLCVTNAVSRHCDIYTTLPPNKDFSTDIFLLPPLIKNENGFDINIGNLGIKNSPSINDLKSIEIIPFPYKWLTQISESPSSYSSSESRATSRESREVNNATMKQLNNVLILPQSFEKGWKAYEIQVKSQNSKVKSLLDTTFPFIFGKELKDHVLVNSWENGWELNDPKTIQQFNNLNNETIVTLFLPQYLEYLGFLLLFGTGVWLIFVYRSTPEKI